jgi:hypothetical protein
MTKYSNEIFKFLLHNIEKYAFLNKIFISNNAADTIPKSKFLTAIADVLQKFSTFAGDLSENKSENIK